MDTGAARRILIVLLGYVVTAWVVLLLAEWLARVFALPPLFDTLLRWGIGLGLPVALLIAWRYPEIGHHGRDP
ncbi:MAG: hypothetical protein ACPGPI_01480 [Longimicrobiales bacterium]|nr:hypothetical protein [Gemmatimonadota bacterium]